MAALRPDFAPLGLLDFVLCALRALRPCDPRNDPLDSKQTLDLVLLLLVFVVILLLLLLLVVVVVIVLLLQKSNARAHISDWCAFALDGVKNVTDQPTNEQGVSKSRMLACPMIQSCVSNIWGGHETNRR